MKSWQIGVTMKEKVKSHVADSTLKKKEDASKELFKAYQRKKTRKIKEKLVLKYINLVKFLAGKFANRGESLEDLIQVGCLGLIKAIERYNPNLGLKFSTYATPNIVGEIKHYFRDKGWFLKVPRRLQKLFLLINKSFEALTFKLKRSPKTSEIAENLGVSEEDVLEAQELGQVYKLVSLDKELDLTDEDKGFVLKDYLSGKDLSIQGLEDRISLEKAFKDLSSNERLVVYLRYYDNLSQLRISRILKVSQMQVSRLERESLKKLRKYLKER